MASAKDIIIAAVPPAAATLPIDAPEEVVNALFRDFRDLMQACGTNKNDKADVLITALIDAGINTGPRIIGAAKRLDLDGQHAGIRLKEGIGQRWSRDRYGKYRNLM